MITDETGPFRASVSIGNSGSATSLGHNDATEALQIINLRVRASGLVPMGRPEPAGLGI